MIHDLRYAARTLLRSPGFAFSAVVALALGVGANTAVFSVVYAVLLKPPPYDEPERLVRLSERTSEGDDSGVVSAGTFVDWRARSRTLESLAVYTDATAGDTLWSSGNRFEVVKTARASPALFSLLRVAPILGRTFRPEAEQDAPSGDIGKIVISYGLWQRSFGGAADVVGRTVDVEGRFPGEIIGVMPRGFAFPENAEGWVNKAFVSAVAPAQRRTEAFHAIARLRRGVTIEAARAELRGISAQVASEQPASNAGWTVQIDPQAGSDTGAVRPALLALLAAVTGVLLIACASVANLLLARASGRRREMAVRRALGAGTLRLVRQCLTEALLLSAFGAAAGLAVGHWLARVLVHLAPPDIPRLADVGMNGTLVLFATVAGLLSGAFIGVAPALQAARTGRHGGVRADARRMTAQGTGVRRMLIGVEVAVVVLLLTGALLLVRTFVKLRGVDLGFQSQHVLEVTTRWPIGRLFPPSPGARAKKQDFERLTPWPRIQRAVDGLLAAVATVPGVEAVGLISVIPLTGDLFSGSVWRADAPGASGLTPPTVPHDRWTADLGIVTPGYFPAMGIPVVRGRNFAESDRLTDDQLNDHQALRSGVAVINRAFASRYFPGSIPSAAH